MNIEKLRRRVGSESDLKVFKQRLIAISKRRVPLPEYGLAVVNPRLARSLDARQPPPTGRTPLKSWMVFFYRTDKLANIPPAASTPLIDDLPDGDELEDARQLGSAGSDCLPISMMRWTASRIWHVNAL